MKRAISYLRESTRAKKTITILVLFLFGLYIFSMPYFSDRKPFNYLVYGIFFLLFSLVITHRFLYFDFKKINIRALLFLFFAVFSTISTVIFSHQFRYLLTIFLIGISYLVFFFMLEQVRKTNLIIEITIWSLFLFVILFIVHYRTDILDFKNLGKERLASDNYFDNVNGVAYYFAGCSLLSFYTALFGKKKYCFIYLIPFAISFFLGILTGSRSFIIEMFFSILVTFIVRFRKKPVVIVVGIGLLTLSIVLLFTLPVFNTIKQRFIGMFNMITGNSYSTDYSTATRILWQDYAFYLGSQHLLFGNGINSFLVYSGTGTYSHSNIAELLCNCGIIGLLVYYLPLFISFYDVLEKKFEFKFFVIVLIVFLLSREFVDVTYNSKFNAFVFSILIFAGSEGLYKKRIRFNNNQYCFLEI